MHRKDVVELIRCLMPDVTAGPFDVTIESDGAGTHICIYIERHVDGPAIMHKFCRFHEQDIIVMKVPSGQLNMRSSKPEKD